MIRKDPVTGIRVFDTPRDAIARQGRGAIAMADTAYTMTAYTMIDRWWVWINASRTCMVATLRGIAARGAFQA